MQIFRPVAEPLGFKGCSNLYHPAAFAVDSILNPSLAGISLCHDLDVLQDENVLQVYMKDSHLVMYMKEQYKADIRAQFRVIDATAIIVQGWSLVLFSVPDPYAEALWEGYNCGLTWVLENDIVPFLSVLSDDNKDYGLLKMMFPGPADDSFHGFRGLAASFASGGLKPASELPLSRMFMHFVSGRQADFVHRFVDTLPKLLSCIFEIQSDVAHDGSLLTLLSELLERMLYLCVPYGHLALISLFRDVDNLHQHGTSANIRLTLELEARRILTKAPMLSTLDRLLLEICDTTSADGADRMLNRLPDEPDFQNTWLDDERIQDINLILGVSFALSKRHEFFAAIKGLEYGRAYLQSGGKLATSLAIITTTELIKCYNALGQESHAQETASHVLEALTPARYRDNRHDILCLRIAIIDTYIGQANYERAQVELEDLLHDISGTTQNSLCCVAALRLNKVLRRQNKLASQSLKADSPLGQVVANMKSVSAETQLQCIEEFSSTVVQLPRSALYAETETIRHLATEVQNHVSLLPETGFARQRLSEFVLVTESYVQGEGTTSLLETSIATPNVHHAPRNSRADSENMTGPPPTGNVIANSSSSENLNRELAAKTQTGINDNTQMDSLLGSPEAREVHHKLATRYLRAMTKALRKNICQLATTGSLASEIGDNELAYYLSADLQDACKYWVDHVKGDESILRNDGAVYKFCREHFLHWVEALSLMGRTAEGLSMITELESTVSSQNGFALQSFTHDARRFILCYWQILEVAPLQVYSSALVFSPSRSLIRELFLDQIPRWFEFPPLVEEQWGPYLFTLEGHAGRVTAVIFSPDRQLVASGSYDKTVRLWDARTGAARGTLQGHSNWVSTVVFSPDGQLVASGSNDNTVRLWDPKTGEARGTLQGHSDRVNTVAFSPDGQLVASGSYDKTVRLWDARTGEAYGMLHGHSGSVNTVAFSPDGQLVASGSDDKTVRLWDVGAGEARGRLQWLRLLGTRRGSVRGRLQGHSNWVSTVAFSPDGQLVASGSGDSTVRLWDARTGAACGTLQGHSNWVSTVVFSPDGQLVASGSDDNTVRLWDARMGEARGTLHGHSSRVNTVVFSPDGQLVASGSNDNTVRLWDARTGEANGTLHGHSGWVNTVAFSPDGQLVASGSIDNTVRLWDARTSEARSTPQGHSGWVNTVVFSPDGQLVASGSYDKTVRLWDSKTGEARGKLQGHSDSVSTVVFSPDGQLVASGSSDKTVRLWDARTGEAHGTLHGHSGWVNTVAFSPDGRLVASGSVDDTVRLWDARTGEARGTSRGHSGWVNTVVFSPDGQLVASGSSDKTVRLWDSKTGAARGKLQGHSDSVSTVVFSPDGQLVASGSHDKTARLWDIKTENARVIKRGPYDEVSFTPDGLRLNVGSEQVTAGVPPSSKSSAEQLRTNSLYSLDDTGQWVSSAGTKFFWIPPDRRPGVVAIRDNIVVLGSRSGRMTFLSFKADVGLSI